MLLAVPTGIVAVSQGAGAIALPYNLFLVDQRLPGIFKLHMLASGAALLLIPLVIALRRTSAWHRPLGYVTAVCVLLGALTALPVALYSHSALMARAGFMAQGIAWLGLIALGVMAVRRRRYGEHARLMLAMAAVASGALWVRLTTTLATGYDLPFDVVYSCAALARLAAALRPRHIPADALGSHKPHTPSSRRRPGSTQGAARRQ
ncbi:MAG: DUF2306 domain-containing protein [Hyphomicrobium sp.]